MKKAGEALLWGLLVEVAMVVERRWFWTSSVMCERMVVCPSARSVAFLLTLPRVVASFGSRGNRCVEAPCGARVKSSLPTILQKPTGIVASNRSTDVEEKIRGSVWSAVLSIHCSSLSGILYHHKGVSSTEI